jgi:hypothetical protein
MDGAEARREIEVEEIKERRKEGKGYSGKG